MRKKDTTTDTPKVKQQLTGSTNLLRHFGLHTNNVLSGKSIHGSYRGYVSHLPGRIKSKDEDTKLGALYREDEWPILPDDDVVIRNFTKEELASFILQEGKLEVC